ncbi:hypothetical protein BpHYR1_023393 [Brachionus plicatilis]|uniref:Uncharacterized protein n=1 Tax=Brachionus plicatilis TaxID=10195 RepID=A0A3M7Q9F1_BRAPC|nr:hypothetical protein BpHYR1_023393 [Brachionus plicatilis]
MNKHCEGDQIKFYHPILVKLYEKKYQICFVKDRVVAGQLKDQFDNAIFYLHIEKVKNKCLWPAGLHPVSRLMASQKNFKCAI